MNRYLVLLIFSPLFFVACGDNLPTANPDNAGLQYDTAVTDNSFVLNGAGYSEDRVDVSNGLHNGWKRTANGEMIAIIQSDWVDHPGRSNVNMSVVLQFPGRRGQHAWSNLFLNDPDSTTIYATMLVGGKKYQSVEGSTEVIFTWNAFGEVIGRYSGTLASAFGDTIRVSDGRFSVQVDQ